MEQPKIADKIFYKIGEVAKILQVKPHVLRYWEKVFQQVRPQKTHSGQRIYRRQDVNILLLIHYLLKDRRFTIAGAKPKLVELIQGGPSPSSSDWGQYWTSIVSGKNEFLVPQKNTSPKPVPPSVVSEPDPDNDISSLYEILQKAFEDLEERSRLQEEKSLQIEEDLRNQLSSINELYIKKQRSLKISQDEISNFIMMEENFEAEQSLLHESLSAQVQKIFRLEDSCQELESLIEEHTEESQKLKKQFKKQKEYIAQLTKEKEEEVFRNVALSRSLSEKELELQELEEREVPLHDNEAFQELQNKYNKINNELKQAKEETLVVREEAERLGRKVREMDGLHKISISKSERLRDESVRSNKEIERLTEQKLLLEENMISMLRKFRKKEEAIEQIVLDLIRSSTS